MLLHEYLYIDTYAILLLVIYKQLKSVSEVQGKSFPWVKALTYKFAVLPTHNPSFLRAVRLLGEVATTVGLD